MGKLTNLPPLAQPLRPLLSRGYGAPVGRGSARERGYTPSWDKAAADHRREFPLCGYCVVGAFGPRRDTPATCVDHLYPHRSFDGVFWQRRYWISSCNTCHSGPKQLVEQRGVTALDDLARALGLPPL